MDTEEKRIGLDELVARALRGSDQRYTLRDWFNYEWNDPAAGAAWESARDEFHKRCRDQGKHYWNDEFKAEREALDAQCPTKHRVPLYHLEASNGWRGTIIHLAPELGAQIDAAWTKKKSRYGSHLDRIGSLTLAGILKRLGQSDITSKIAATKKAAAEKAARNSRNYHRQQIVELATKLQDAVAKARADGVEVTWASNDQHGLDSALESLKAIVMEINPDEQQPAA